MTSSQPKFFIDSDNPRPEFPFDDDPIDEDFDCTNCSRRGSEHSVAELLRCALNELRGVKVES